MVGRRDVSIEEMRTDNKTVCFCFSETVTCETIRRLPASRLHPNATDKAADVDST